MAKKVVLLENNKKNFTKKEISKRKKIEDKFNEINVKKKILVPPKKFSKEEKKIWRDLINLNKNNDFLTDLDYKNFSILCYSIAQFELLSLELQNYSVIKKEYKQIFDFLRSLTKEIKSYTQLLCLDSNSRYKKIENEIENQDKNNNKILYENFGI